MRGKPLEGYPDDYFAPANLIAILISAVVMGW